MFKKLALLAALPFALSLVACEQKSESSGSQEAVPAASDTGGDESSVDTGESAGAAKPAPVAPDSDAGAPAEGDLQVQP